MQSNAGAWVLAAVKSCHLCAEAACTTRRNPGDVSLFITTRECSATRCCSGSYGVGQVMAGLRAVDCCEVLE